jgi:hypothetical protein
MISEPGHRFQGFRAACAPIMADGALMLSEASVGMTKASARQLVVGADVHARRDFAGAMPSVTGAVMMG